MKKYVIILIVISVILIVALAIGLYFLLQKNDENKDRSFVVTVVGGPSAEDHPGYEVGGGNKYAINGSVAESDVTLTLYQGGTYKFDQSDSTNETHPLRFSITSNGIHGGGTEYSDGVITSGVPGNQGAYTQITVAVGAPTLYYYCTAHNGMGWKANTP
tara:strand:+ start:48046 stop:48522 length:477 start_codon:yes stop_codon:yes gene_type:complete